MYIVRLFDGLLVPDEIRRGDVQDIGSGSSLTSFLPLPGGGFYDNYQSRKSPQGIRPISKSGLFLGTDDELQAYLDDWRAKLGVRGRLVLEYDNGDLRWQWARLQDVSTPRDSTVKGGWLPFALTWITAAQNWRGVVYGDGDWTWGDESWVFGDGSASMGVGAQEFTLSDADQTVTVTHNGNIDAPNVTLFFDIEGTWQDVTIINLTTGQQIIIDRAASAERPWLEINAGARSILMARQAANTIATVSRSLNTLTVTTLLAHGLVEGDPVLIEDTDEYDGLYYPATVTSATVFTVPISSRHTGYGTVAAGTATGLIELYEFTTFSDRERWFVLAPGDNDIRVIWSPEPTIATMRVEFVDHYA